MHYRNGREAKTGDKIVQITTVYSADGKTQVPEVRVLGVLYLGDCLHVDDVANFLKENGLDKRPEGTREPPD